MQKKISWRKEDEDGKEVFVMYVLSEFFILPVERVGLFSPLLVSHSFLSSPFVRAM